MRVKCTCSHEYQDKLYGKGIRIANPTAKAEVRCTVCSALHRISDDGLKKKKSGGGGGGGGSKTHIAVPPPGGWPGGAPEKNGWKP